METSIRQWYRDVEDLLLLMNHVTNLARSEMLNAISFPELDDVKEEKKIIDENRSKLLEKRKQIEKELVDSIPQIECAIRKLRGGLLETISPGIEYAYSELLDFKPEGLSGGRCIWPALQDLAVIVVRWNSTIAKFWSRESFELDAKFNKEFSSVKEQCPFSNELLNEFRARIALEKSRLLRDLAPRGITKHEAPKTQFGLLCRHAIQDMYRECQHLENCKTEGPGTDICIAGSFVNVVEVLQENIALTAARLFPELVIFEMQDTWPVVFRDRNWEGNLYFKCSDPLGGLDRPKLVQYELLKYGGLRSLIEEAESYLQRWQQLEFVKDKTVDGTLSGLKPSSPTTETYKWPDEYERDNWIYQNIDKNSYRDTVTKLKKLSEDKKWNLVESRNGIKKIAKRFAEFHQCEEKPGFLNNQKKRNQ